MPSDPIWFILLGISLLINILLLFLPQIRRVLHLGENVSEDEIMAMVEEGQESGAISIKESEREIIENVFEFNNMTAEDVMVHRTDVVMLSLDETADQILEMIRQSGLSRFPVYDQDADDIVGILSTRVYLLNETLETPLPLREILRPAYFVPESVPADVLFRDMQNKHTHLALVVDEYGGTSGLVTLEDLLEELVGNIYDEFDPQDEQDIIKLSDTTWRVSGSADLEELFEHLDIPMPEGEDELDCDTLGGLVYGQLSVIPEDGSCPQVEVLGLRIHVDALHDRRVEWATVEKLETSPAEL